MVDRTGSLDLDDTGHYDYHGHSSGYSFMRRFRAQFGDNFLPVPPTPKNHQLENKYIANAAISPKSLQSLQYEGSLSINTDLPPKHVAIELCKNAIDDCCALQRPLHRPTFFRRLDSIYQTDPDNYTNDHVKFLPLLYAVLAVGSLFGAIEGDSGEPDAKFYKTAIAQGYQYFNTAKAMMDVTETRDIVSIQTVIFMILFLQGTAKLATCYAYIGVALRACCRLGMHRRLDAKFNLIEQEERKRAFWLVRKFDIYIGAMLGLPLMLSNDDVDQDSPIETEDENITETTILQNVSTRIPLIKATNAHSRLMGILQKVVRYIYPTKPPAESSVGTNYIVKHSLVRELEQDLQQWMDELPMQLRPSENDDTELSRVQQLLRMAYAHVQMLIYRPFLHYVSQNCQNGQTDKRSFACAAACVSVARNVVHITTEMRRRGLLMGAYWFVMYTTYFAILSLLYFVLENPESATSKDILRDALEGRTTLASLANRSMAADRCSSSLSSIFDALPQKLQERRASFRTQPNTSRKRPPPPASSSIDESSTVSLQAVQQSFPPAQVGMSTARNPARPSDLMQPITATNRFVPGPVTAVPPLLQHRPDLTFAPHLHDESVFNSPMTTAPTISTGDIGTPTIMQGQLSDLNDVMFPGNNPFEYPNQPMSLLEGTQFGDLQTSPYNEIPSLASQSTHAPQFPPQMTQRQTQAQMSESAWPQQTQQAQLQQSLFDMQNVVDEPNQAEPNYWSYNPGKTSFRTGLTSGVPGVNFNLDDIFGDGPGWGMGMGLGLDGTSQYSHQNQQNQQSQNLAWSQQQQQQQQQRNQGQSGW